MIDPKKIQVETISHPKDKMVQVSAGISLCARAFADFRSIEMMKHMDPVEITKFDVQKAIWDSIYGDVLDTIICARNNIIHNNKIALRQATDELGELIEQLTYKQPLIIPPLPLGNGTNESKT